MEMQICQVCDEQLPKTAMYPILGQKNLPSGRYRCRECHERFIRTGIFEKHLGRKKYESGSNSTNKPRETKHFR